MFNASHCNFASSSSTQLSLLLNLLLSSTDSIETVDLSSCGFNGPLPSLPPQLPSTLTLLSLARNSFCGSLPDSWSLALVSGEPSFVTIDLSSNLLNSTSGPQFSQDPQPLQPSLYMPVPDFVVPILRQFKLDNNSIAGGDTVMLANNPTCAGEQGCTFINSQSIALLPFLLDSTVTLTAIGLKDSSTSGFSLDSDSVYCDFVDASKAKYLFSTLAIEIGESQYNCTIAASGSSTMTLVRLSTTLGRSTQFISLKRTNPCPVGFADARGPNWTSQPSSTWCRQVAAGNYSLGLFESRCASGTYSSQAGASSCSQCEFGTFTAQPGQVQCQNAPAGSYVATLGATSAVLCPRGFFSATNSSVSCSRCPADTYSNTTGLSSCFSCPANSVLPELDRVSIQSCRCNISYYGSPLLGGCRSCAIGLDCPEIGMQLPNVRDGYTIVPLPQNYSLDALEVQVLECSPSTACLYSSDATTVNCEDGYEGLSCGSCKPDYYRSGGACYSCPTEGGTGYFVLLFVVAFALCSFLVYTGKPSSRRVFAPLLAITFLQQISVLSRATVEWPHSATRVYTSVSFLNIDIAVFRPECSTGFSYFEIWGFRLFIAPLGLAIFCLLRAFLALCNSAWECGVSDWSCFSSLRQRRPGHLFSSTMMNSRFICAIITFLNLDYMQLVSAGVELFDCTKQPAGFYTMTAYPAMRCYSDDWMKKVPYAIAALCIYGAGIPLLFFILMVYQRRRSANPMSPGAAAALDHPSNSGDLFALRFGALTNAYNSDHWYYEICHMARRAALVLSVSFLNATNSVHLQANSALLIIFVSALSVIFMAPYELQYLNQLTLIWLLSCVYVIVSALAFGAQISKSTDGSAQSILRSTDSQMFAVLLFIVLGASIAISAWVTVYELRKGRRITSNHHASSSLEHHPNHHRYLSSQLLSSRLEHLAKTIDLSPVPIHQQEQLVQAVDAIESALAFQAQVPQSEQPVHHPQLTVTISNARNNTQVATEMEMIRSPQAPPQTANWTLQSPSP